MNHLVFGSNTPNFNDLGELIHVGQDGDAAEQAIADNRDKFAVIRRTLPGFEAFLRTVQQFDPNHPAAAKPAPVETAPEPVTAEPIAEAAPEPPAEEPQVTPEPKHKRSPRK